MRIAHVALFTAAASCLLAIPRVALALQQPNGVTIPTAPGCANSAPSGLLAAFACACTQQGTCNIGTPCASQQSCDNGMHGTCESTMWHSFNDNTCIPSNHSGLDPVAEASTMPETFHPTCALTFTILTRGTSQFRDVFGWYNVTGNAPASSDLHPMLGCTDGAGTSVVLDIAHEPSYLGGDIGFFLLTPQNHTSNQCAGGDCCPTIARLGGGVGYVFYSQRAFNPDQSGPNSYIHLLTYGSHLSHSKFYFAWEDLLSGGDNNFTDLVTSVDGVQCSGGGETCNTGQKGACANGVTECAQGVVGCTPIATAGSEACNGLDDDCDGVVDNAATCPTAGDVCQNGVCVKPCTRGEFHCAVGTTCDNASALCVDPTCVGVACSADKVCRGGACVAACDGVVCPHAQSCVGDKCVDLCAGVTCATGQVCREGVCFAGCAACDGVVCGAGLKCDTAKNDCVDPSCANGCAAGTFCKNGACVDDCDGAKCPAGQACVNGACGDGGGDAGADGGFNPIVDGDGGAGGGDSGADNGDAFASGHAACMCDAVGGGGSGGAASGIAVAIAALFARRRRRA